jgi:hypothetical protein
MPLGGFGVWMMSVTSLALSQITADTHEIVIAGISSLRGVGMGMAMMPVSTMAFNAVSQAELPRASAMQNAAQRILGSSSAAILTTILALSFVHHGGAVGQTVTSQGVDTGLVVLAFSDAFKAMAIVAAVGLLGALFAHDDVLVAHQKGEQAVAMQGFEGSTGGGGS